MTPVRNQILVKPFPPDEMTEGGLYVPDSVKKPSDKVHIVKVGNGTKDKPMKLKEGQTGFRVHEWGCPVMIENELHFIMDMDAILAVE